MNEPTQVRSKRLRMFLEQMTWDCAELAGLVYQRRQEFTYRTGEDEAQIQSKLQDIFDGRRKMEAALAAELALYFDALATDFLGQVLNGEQAEIDRVCVQLQNTEPVVAAASDNGTPDLQRPIKELRSEALKAAMEARGFKPADVARKRHPRRGPTRNAYRGMISRCMHGNRIVPDDEIDKLAEILEVERSVLWIRDLTDTEQEYIRRAALAQEGRKKARRKTSKKAVKKAAAKKATTPKPAPTTPLTTADDRPKRAGYGEPFPLYDETALGNAVIAATDRQVYLSDDRRSLVVVLPLSDPAAIGRIMGVGK